jgi:hypothetical protein
MRTIFLVLCLAFSGVAVAADCPVETHYPCGSDSCCPK